MDFTIRAATEQDVVLVSSMLTEAAEWLASAGMPMWRIDALTQDEVRKTIGNFHIAEDSSRSAAGVVRIQMEDTEFWPDVPDGESIFLHRFAVNRDFAARGVSTCLLDFAVRRAESLGKRFVRLDCAADRPKLRAVYENYGFNHHSDRLVGPFQVARYEYELIKQPNQSPQTNTGSRPFSDDFTAPETPSSPASRG